MHLKQVVTFLKSVNEFETAKTLLKTFVKYSNNLEQFDQLAMLFLDSKAYSESLEMLQRCSGLCSNPQEIYCLRSNLSKVYNVLNNPEESIINSAENLKVDPKDFELTMEQAFSYYLLGDYQKSFEIQKRLMNEPGVPEEILKKINFNMGTFDLYEGKFKEGIQKIVYGGKEIGVTPKLVKPFISWNGEKTDKTIIVYGEGGLGDEFIGARFIKEIERRGGKAVWISNHKLTELFNRNGISSDLENNLGPIGNYVYCTAMTLPILLDIDEDDLWHGPYLSPNQQHIDKWKEILPERFITLKWQGNPYYDQDLHRNLDLNKLIEILAPYNIPLVSLQIDDKQPIDNVIIPNIEDWEDTLAIQYLARLNITSCTSTAHSASAMGANTIVLPPIATYYPWINLRENDSSRWYGINTKCFPQTKHKDWTEPFDEVKKYMESNLGTLDI